MSLKKNLPYLIFYLKEYKNKHLLSFFEDKSSHHHLKTNAFLKLEKFQLAVSDLTTFSSLINLPSNYQNIVVIHDVLNTCYINNQFCSDEVKIATQMTEADKINVASQLKNAANDINIFVIAFINPLKNFIFNFMLICQIYLILTKHISNTI